MEHSTPEHSPQKKAGGWYALFSLLASFGMPVAVAFTMQLTHMLRGVLPFGMAYGTPAQYLTFGMAALVCMAFGWVLGRKATLPSLLFWRYLPLVSPLLALCGFAIYLILAQHQSFRGFVYPILFLGLSAMYIPYLVAFTVAARKKPCTKKLRGLAGILVLFLASGVAVAGVWQHEFKDLLSENYDTPSVGHGVDPWLYKPFHNGNRLAAPAQTPTLSIEHAHPRLDGAIAMLPLYGAVAQALYRNMDEQTAYEFVACNNTPEAYRRLADGEVDIFFGAEPSEEQKAYAREQGVEFTVTPVAREAFVFLVNKDNPVTSLTLEQIRAIYTRDIRSWRDVGGGDAPILAFQRPEGSGSQTAMLGMVMRGQAMMKPLREEYMEGMGDIINRVAAYRNRENALGYSFRWYATVQYANPDIRLLAVNGVPPTEENIRNGAYPLIGPVVAVTARPLSPESRALMEWVLGPEGQELIRRTGYVPLND